jgi:hypothetical protein
MSIDSIILWILGVIAAIIGIGLKLILELKSDNAQTRERVIRIEVMLDLMGRKAARSLHSPHDPYGIDSMLDKYLDRHYELSWDEWKALLARCEAIEARTDITKDERWLAGMVGAICMHKLMLPPPMRRQIERIANRTEDAIVNKGGDKHVPKP